MFILQKNKMCKGFIFTGLLITFALSYLFYRLCKRDTIVISPIYRVSMPDSSWLYGSINLEQTTKDIAWSTLLNGDFNKIFQIDTNTNTLLKILRYSNNYSIAEQHSIRYFSVWKDSINYKGLLFALENDVALQHAFKSDSFSLNQKKIYSFRSNEGIWLYNANNLLFVSGLSDSLVACSFFTETDTLQAPISSDIRIDTLDVSSYEVLISGHINTLFVPTAIKPALLDSALLSFKVMRNDAMLDITFNYKGFLTATVNQSSITHQNNEAALFYAANLNVAGIENILNKIPSLHQSYQKQKTTIDPFLVAMDNNNLTLEFNGWKKIKNTYYTSVMNDEFETVLQKKDSSIIEPIFKISLEQKNKPAARVFLSYLQKEGLVSKFNQQPFAIIYGNFDSELILNENHTFILHNKHTPLWARTPGPSPLDAALFITIKPASLKGLSDSNISKSDLLEEFGKYKQINSIMLHVQKQQNSLTGTLKIKFIGENHPLISLMKVLKNSSQ